MAAVEEIQNFQVMRVNHREKVGEALESMFDEESLCDVTICCAGQQVKAHRVILAASSLYFKEVFSATLPGQYPIVFVKSISIEDLNAILEFIYKGEVTVPRDQLTSLISSADCLGVLGLGKLNPAEPSLNGPKKIRSHLLSSDGMTNGSNSGRVLPNGSHTASSTHQRDHDESARRPASLPNGSSVKNASVTNSTANLGKEPPKKRGKKRKNFAGQDTAQADDVKPVVSKTNGHHANGHSSSPASTTSSSSSSNRKSSSASPPNLRQSSSNLSNGHHAAAGGASTDLEAQEQSSRLRRSNSLALNRPNGLRARAGTPPVPVVQEQQRRPASPEDVQPMEDSDAEVEIDDNETTAESILSNGSMDLSRKSTRSSAEEAPPPPTQQDQQSAGDPGEVSQTAKKPITKSKLRSWSAQISQSANVPETAATTTTSSPPPPTTQTPTQTSTRTSKLNLSVKLPNLNVSALKNDINEQLAATARCSTHGGSGSGATHTSSSTPTPTTVDIKPLLGDFIPANIKMDPRPRGRPKKSVTANAAIVPRPLNPLLGLARSSLAAKVAAAAAGSLPSSPVSSATSSSAPATPVSTPTVTITSNASTSSCASTSTAIPPLRLAPKIGSTPTVKIIDSTGAVLSTHTTSPGNTSSQPDSEYVSSRCSSSASSTSSDLHGPLASTSAQQAPLEVPKKRGRGRPPLSSLTPKPSQVTGGAPEPKVHPLKLKIPNQFAHFLKTPTVQLHNNGKSGNSTSTQASTSSSGVSTKTPFTLSVSSSSTSSSSGVSSSHPRIHSPSSSAATPSQPRAPLMATLSSGASLAPAANGLISVPRFTPIVTDAHSRMAPATDEQQPEFGSL